MKKKLKFPFYNQLDKLIFDFDGVFTNNKVLVNSKGDEFVICDRGDGLGINLLNKYKSYVNWDLDILVLTKERNDVVLSRCNKLGLKCINAIDDKASFLKSTYSESYHEGKNMISKLMYVGNDLNDLEAIKISEFSCAPYDAHPLVKKSVDFIFPNLGGDNFVRSLIERLLDFDNKKETEIIEIMKETL